MVLGNVGDAPVCYYCNKPGHIRKDCFKFRNDLAGGRGAGNSGRGGGGRGGRHGGRHSGGRSLNVMQEQQDVHEVMRLGMAALANKEKQQQAVNSGKNVSFADNVGESKGQYTQSKN